MNDAPLDGALSAIELEARTVDAAGAAAAAPPGAEQDDPHIEREQPAQEAPPLTTAQQLDAFLLMILAGATKKLPALADVWSDEARGLFVTALAPVLDKYDCAPSAFFMRWKDEVMAVMVCVPLLWQTAGVLREALEAARAEAAKTVPSAADTEPRAPG